MSTVLELSQQLMAINSVTPNDGGCQELIANELKTAEFVIENHRVENVDNLWAFHGAGNPVFVFVGHTDVVPPGNLDDWNTDPFKPAIKNNILYGRGAADMKTAVAAMTLALKDFVTQNPNHPGTLALLITSDEEGGAYNGVKAMVEMFKQNKRRFDYCLVGEPSSLKSFADNIRIGRRGSITATLKINGKQGHVAYPELAKNPIHHALPFLQALHARQWDEKKHLDFPDTSMQIVNIQSGLGVNNVIPADINIVINWRFSPSSSADSIKQALQKLLKTHDCDYDVSWHLSGKPFITDSNSKLVKTVQAVCQQEIGITPTPSTGGGTSDGRFVAEICDQIVELGVINESIHKINEHVVVDDIDRLKRLYQKILQALF